MFSLTRNPENSIEYEGKNYKLNLAFDRVLLFYEYLQKEKDSEPAETVAMGLSLLCASSVKGLSLEDRFNLLDLIFKERINTKNDGPKGEPKVMDFLIDAERIYSGFVQAYGMDLTEQRDRLSWAKFIALLDGLPASTRFREVISIRARPIPKPTKYNAEERAELMKLKQYYSLEQGLSYEEGLEKLWTYAKGQAK